VLHFAGDGGALAALLTPGGRIAATLGLTPKQLGCDDVTLAPIMASPVTATLAKLADAAAAGIIIRVPIMRISSLEQVPEGLADFPTSTLGNRAAKSATDPSRARRGLAIHLNKLPDAATRLGGSSAASRWRVEDVVRVIPSSPSHHVNVNRLSVAPSFTMQRWSQLVAIVSNGS
jgi:hypothetical protein